MGRWLQLSGRAHASGADTCEVVGSIPGGWWAICLFLSTYFSNNVLKQVPQRGASLLLRCKKILAMMPGAKQA